MGIERSVDGTQAAWLAYLSFVVLGVLTCFAGYRLFRVILGVWGFVGGAVIGASLAQGLGVDLIVKMGMAILGGIAGAVLVSVLYVVGVFLFGAGFGLVLASTIQDVLHLAISPWPLLLLLGLLGGVAALVLQKPLIALFTAFGGAWVVVAASGALVLGCPLESFPTHCLRPSRAALLALVPWLVLGLIGFATQVRTRHGSPEDREAGTS